MDAHKALYMQKMLHKLAVVLLIVGGLNWGLIATAKVNLVERVFGKGSILATSIYALVGLAALSLAFNRDTYLPFLGEAVLPCSILSEQAPLGATKSVVVQVEPGAKVIYWATEPGDNDALLTWDKAYRDYRNAGVAVADNTGAATLKVREPQPYKVPFKGRLEQHIHFRVCGPSGFIGRIKTIFLKDGHVEGFRDGF